MSRLTLVLAVLLLAAPAIPSRGDYLGKSAAQWQKEFETAKDAKAKRNAAFALGKLGSEALAAESALVRCLQSDKEDAGVRETAAYSLGQIVPHGGASADLTRLLAKLATSKGDDRIRRSAVVALGSCGPDNADTRAALESALDDPNAGVRQNAVWALGEVCERSDNLPVTALRKALRDGDKLVKRDAALALGKITAFHSGGGEEREQREADRVAKVRKKAQEAIPDLVACVGHDYVELRKAACGTLVDLVDAKQDKAKAALAKACTDEDVEVRRNAALALANIGGAGTRPAVPVLLDALRNGDVELKRLAALAFRGVGSEASDAVSELLKVITKDPDLKVRYNTAVGLGGFKNDANKVVPTLVDRVADTGENLDIRMAAAMSLQSLGECEQATKAIARLVTILDDSKQPARVRERVLWALRVHGNDLANHEEVFRVMKKVLTEPELIGAGRSGKMLRYDSAFLLSVFKASDAPEEVFPVLKEFLDDKTIRIFTGVVVKGGGVKEGGSGQTGVNESGTEDGRKMAIAALGRIGAARLKGQTEILERVRQLRDDEAVEENLRKAAGKLLTDIGVK